MTVARRRVARGRRGRSLRILALSVSIGAELLAPPARAQVDKDLARQQWEQGTADYTLGHYVQAVAHYEQGYRALPDPVFLFNIGQAERLAGEREQALLAYRSYLRSSAEGAPKRDIAERWIAELETEPPRVDAPSLRARPGRELARPGNETSRAAGASSVVALGCGGRRRRGERHGGPPVERPRRRGRRGHGRHGNDSMKTILIAAGLAPLLALAAGCSRPDTEVLLVVSSELTVPGALDHLAISAHGATVDGGFSRTYDLTQTPNHLPLSLGLLAAGDPSGPLHIEVTGLVGDVVVATRAIDTSFVPEQVRVLRVDLETTTPVSGADAGVDASAADAGAEPDARDDRRSSHRRRTLPLRRPTTPAVTRVRATRERM